MSANNRPGYFSPQYFSEAATEDVDYRALQRNQGMTPNMYYYNSNYSSTQGGYGDYPDSASNNPNNYGVPGHHNFQGSAGNNFQGPSGNNFQGGSGSNYQRYHGQSPSWQQYGNSVGQIQPGVFPNNFPSQYSLPSNPNNVANYQMNNAYRSPTSFSNRQHEQFYPANGTNSYGYSSPQENPSHRYPSQNNQSSRDVGNHKSPNVHHNSSSKDNYDKNAYDEEKNSRKSSHSEPPPKDNSKDKDTSASNKKTAQIMVGKRRGGRILPTGVVKKQKQDSNSKDGRSDAWGQYMAEVRRYKEQCCQEERKNRPLVK